MGGENILRERHHERQSGAPSEKCTSNDCGIDLPVPRAEKVLSRSRISYSICMSCVVVVLIHWSYRESALSSYNYSCVNRV